MGRSSARKGGDALLSLENRKVRGWELESDTSRRGSSVKGRACTIFFHAETQRTAADVAVIASLLDLFGGRADGDAAALAKVIALRLLGPASAGAGARHREVAARWSAGEASGGRRGGEAISPGNEVGYFFSARTISRTVDDRSAPHRPSGRGGRPWQGGTYAAARRESLASDHSWACAPGTLPPRVRRAFEARAETQPQQPARGEEGTARSGLQPGSTAPLTGSADGSVRDRYRSHSSFVDGRDKHLDVILGQRVAPSFTPRPRLASTAARGHE